MLREEGFTGGYSGVKKHVRPTPDNGPGKMGESDWSPYE